MRSLLTAGLSELGLAQELSADLENFSRYMLQQNLVMNLTAITEPRQVAQLHLLDSLCLVPMADWKGKSVVDVGSGAGFPGMPLAIALPDTRFTLLDSLNKRIVFLQQAAALLGLGNTVCVHSRAEEFAGEHRECFDLAVSRAVADLSVLCELCLPLVSPGGCFLAMKSSHTEEEISLAKRGISLLGGKIEAVKDYTIPTTDVVHRAVVIRKISPTPKQYPRRFSQIKKQPLGKGECT